jgi:XTP/dITP diphosphohydrolase
MADRVCGAHPDDRLVAAVMAAAVRVEIAGELDSKVLAARLLETAVTEAVVWLLSPQWTPGLIEELAAQAQALPHAPPINRVIGSWDPPGSSVLELVRVMDRLRSPGGCPWDGAQSHRSLVPYLVEEAYEAVQAIEDGIRKDIVEELGDLLMQVVFHARIGEEHHDDPFNLDQVAQGITRKLIGRQQWLFDPKLSNDPADPVRDWAAAKAQEKSTRATILDGIPAAMPTLERATKIMQRLRENGLDHLANDVASLSDPYRHCSIGANLLAVVQEAVKHDVDPANALRMTLHKIEAQVIGGPHEGGTSPSTQDPLCAKVARQTNGSVMSVDA